MPDWVKYTSANTVQHAYVSARVHDINGKGVTKVLGPTLDALKAEEPTMRKADRKKLQDAFMRMNERLQSAPLTINFRASAWFMQPNNFESYAQMYERAVTSLPGGGKQMQLRDDSLNTAVGRAAADDIATLPASMANLKWDPAQQKMAAHQVGGTPGKAPGRGLAPGARGMHEVARALTPGILTKVVAGNDTYYTSQNAAFDPRAKQKFAALNYGRRPNGSCITYGLSHLVLSDKFKRDALFLAGDTFGNIDGSGKKVAAEDQCTYDLLAGVFLKANPMLRKALLDSCLRDARLPNTKEADLLLEAHLFADLKFTGGIQTIYLSRHDTIKDPKTATNPDPPARPMTDAEFATAQRNAQAFAWKHGARLIYDFHS